MHIKLTPEQIIQIHESELREAGGLPGIKDPGYVDLICEKPFTDYFGEEQYPGLFLKAAVYLHGLATAHCFFDANKRTALLTTLTFLDIEKPFCRAFCVSDWVILVYC